MTNNLLIVFVKNIKLGKVKTRLAKTIGNDGAFEVYKELVNITENVTTKVETDIHVYFSEAVIETNWHDAYKFVQNGADLGERMKNAFQHGFDNGYKRIVLIGSDLPDITSEIIEEGFNKLVNSTVVLGPAKDGGYYLIGLSKMNSFIFHNKPWSQSNLFEETILELTTNLISYQTLETLNDIDTFEDLIASNFYQNNVPLQQKLKAFHD